MCNNNVILGGNAAAVETVKVLFKVMQENEEENKLPWVVSPLIEKYGYIGDVWQKDETIHFRSRWVPNLNLLVGITIEYGVDFTNKYDELDTCVFGESTCICGAFTDTRLDHNDFKAISYDEEKELFIYKGWTYDDQWPILEELLEEKQARDLNFETASDISKEELLQIYNELLPGDYVLKLAEHKNFNGARKAFFELDDNTATGITNYMADHDWNNPNQYATHDKYIAMNFLRTLVSEWDWQRQQRQHQNGRGL